MKWCDIVGEINGRRKKNMLLQTLVLTHSLFLKISRRNSSSYILEEHQRIL
jgi:hypothetical protein